MDRLQESVTFKLILIAFLTIVLLIPSALVGDLITERAMRQNDVIKDIAGNWAGSQTIKGPVLVIPYRRVIRSADPAKPENSKEVIENLYVLPENLNFKAHLKTEVLHKGIFEAVVYNTAIQVSGNFSPADLTAVSISPDQLMLDKAKITFSITDLKGLKNNPVISATGKQLTVQPSFGSNPIFTNGLESRIDLTAQKDAAFAFNFTIDLKGSQDLHFMHLGKTTDVQLTGDWATPDFDGRSLPNTRHVSKSGFDGHWRMIYYNRPYPQQWVVDNTLLNDEKNEETALFGVTLRQPVDQYQKTMRTSKYAILIILLTFVSLFLTEVIRKQRVHIFNYILIGAAMIIYYTLLLSFSEKLGYNIAYLIASVATIGLIWAFISSLLNNKKAAGLFALILAIFYTFIFVIIQLEDFALMIGSIALFIITAVLMYFSRKINWEKH